jgi:hypothetical protein
MIVRRLLFVAQTFYGSNKHNKLHLLQPWYAGAVPRKNGTLGEEHSVLPQGTKLLALQMMHLSITTK